MNPATSMNRVEAAWALLGRRKQNSQQFCIFPQQAVPSVNCYCLCFNFLLIILKDYKTDL